MRGEIGAQLKENFTERQTFRSQPPRQRPAGHAKRLRDRAELRLAMRQERSDRIFDSDLQRTLSGAAICKRLLAIVEQHLIEMRIRGDETKLLCFLVEGIRSVFAANSIRHPKNFSISEDWGKRR